MNNQGQVPSLQHLALVPVAHVVAKKVHDSDPMMYVITNSPAFTDVRAGSFKPPITMESCLKRHHHTDNRYLLPFRIDKSFFSIDANDVRQS